MGNDEEAGLKYPINGVTYKQNQDGTVDCYCETLMEFRDYSSKYKTCFLEKDVECTFATGDGYGGEEVSEGYKKTEAECIATCRANPIYNGVTVKNQVVMGKWNAFVKKICIEEIKIDGL